MPDTKNTKAPDLEDVKQEVPEEAKEASEAQEEKAAEKAKEEPCEKSSQEDALKEAKAKADEYLDRWRRSAAEFENFRKRSEKEREQSYQNGQISAINVVLPLLDNLERALSAIPEEEKESATYQGVKMSYDQFVKGLAAIGLAEIPAEGERFDPDKHNAVMHIEDETIDENTVCEVFQKGYTLNGKVVRYSMVKVAN